MSRLLPSLLSVCALTASAADPFGEAGYLSIVQPDRTTFHTQPFIENYPVAPVVFLGPPTTASDDPLTVRVKNGLFISI